MYFNLSSRKFVSDEDALFLLSEGYKRTDKIVGKPDIIEKYNNYESYKNRIDKQILMKRKPTFNVIERSQNDIKRFKDLTLIYSKSYKIFVLTAYDTRFSKNVIIKIGLGASEINNMRSINEIEHISPLLYESGLLEHIQPHMNDIKDGLYVKNGAEQKIYNLKRLLNSVWSSAVNYIIIEAGSSIEEFNSKTSKISEFRLIKSPKLNIVKLRIILLQLFYCIDQFIGLDYCHGDVKEPNIIIFDSPERYMNYGKYEVDTDLLYGKIIKFIDFDGITHGYCRDYVGLIHVVSSLIKKYNHGKKDDINEEHIYDNDLKDIVDILENKNDADIYNDELLINHRFFKPLIK
jgi:hypothetical protein